MPHDDFFRGLGAVSVYDERFPAPIRRYDGQPASERPLFARYYFNAQGTEIGYYLVCMAPHTSPHIHPTPRVWGIPHTLAPL